MKKLLLSLITIIFVSSFLSGQSFKILDKQGVDLTSDTVYLWGDVNTASLELHIDIKNTSASLADMKLKIVPNWLITNSYYNYCLGLSCFSLAGSQPEIPPVTIPIKADSSYRETLLDCFPNGQLGESSLTYVFFNAANTSDTAFVTVIYNTTPVGIKNVDLKENAIGNIYPNPAQSLATLNYNLEGYNQNAKVVLYDMLGNNVKEFDLIGNNQGKISINTNEMPNGVYFYALRSSNKTVATRRLIVNH